MTDVLELDSDRELLERLPALHPDAHATLIVNRGRVPNADAFATAFRAARGMVSDFDGTAHAGNQWGDLRRHMTAAHRADDEADLKGYFVPGRTRTPREDIAFLCRSARRLVDSGLRREMIKTCARQAAPRHGAEELYASFGDEVAFVTYGVWEFVTDWADHHGIKAEAFGLRFDWSTFPLQRNATGFQLGTAVTEHNKGACREIFCAARNLDPNEVVVLGDAPTDLQMMSPDNLGVLLIPKIDPDQGRMAFRLAGLHEMWPRVAAVLVSDSLAPLAELRS